MEQNELSIEEKEKYWKECIIKKEDPDTTEQHELEFYSQVLYEDDEIVVLKECVDNYEIDNKINGEGVTFGGYDMLFTLDLGECMQDDKYNGITLLDYLRERGFPIQFEIWW